MPHNGSGSRQDRCTQNPVTSTQSINTAQTHKAQSAEEKLILTRRLNDRFRRTFLGGRLLITRGVEALADGMRVELFNGIRAYDAFSPENDPYTEHDFGSVKVGGQLIFWKIDYYDADLVGGSPDPSDPAVTTRVMTVMLAEEY